MVNRIRPMSRSPMPKDGMSLQIATYQISAGYYAVVEWLGHELTRTVIYRSPQAANAAAVKWIRDRF